jgi:tetratricopeptide (TPR) repeat protein
VVTGEYYRRGEELEVVAHILDPVEGRNVYDLQGAQGNPDDPMGAFEVVGQQVVGASANFIQAEGSRWVEVLTPPPSLPIYRMSLEANELRSMSRHSEALAIYQQMSELDTAWLSYKVQQQSSLFSTNRFAEADSVWAYLDVRRDRLTRMEQAWADYLHAFQQGDFEQEYRIVREMVEMDPASAAYNAANTCSRSNRLDEAMEHIAMRDTTSLWGLNWYNWDSVHFSVLVRLGLLEDALELSHHAQTRHPESTGPLLWEAEVLTALGRIDEVQAVLEEARAHPATTGSWSPAEPMRIAAMVAAATGRTEEARRFSELALAEASQSQGDTRGLRARALAYAQRWGEAETLFRELVEETPTSRGNVGLLGWVLANQGKRHEAESMRDRLVELEPVYRLRGLVLYWEAAISTSLGEHGRAIRELQEAVRSGYRYGPWTIWYPWFTPLHDDPRYQALVAPK